MYKLPCISTKSCTTLELDITNSSAVLTPAAKGFQLFGTEPGAAASDVLTNPLRLLIIGLSKSSAFLSTRLPATRNSLNALITPQETKTGFLDLIAIVISSM